MPVPLRLVDPEPAPLGLYSIEMAAHCGRLAGALRVLLNASGDANRDVARRLAEVALEMFDNWQESSTGAVRSTGMASADGPRKDGF